MSKIFRKTKIFYILFISLILSLLSSYHKDFWFDEAFSWIVAKTPINNLLMATAADNNPPLYYLFLHFWLKLNQSAFFLRLPSLIFGLLTLLLIYKIANWMFNQKTAFISTLLLSLSPLHYYYSAEARMYSMWSTICLTIFYLYLKILKKPKKSDYIFLAFCSLLASYTHYFTIFFLIPLDLFLFWQRKKYHRQLTRLILGQLLALVLFLPWLAYFLSFSHPVPWTVPPLLGLPLTFLSFVLAGVGMITLKVFFNFNVSFMLRFIFSLSVVFFCLFFLLGSADFRQNKKTQLLLLLTLLPQLLVSGLSYFHPVYSLKPFMVLTPFFFLLSAKGISQLDRQLAKIGFLWAVLLLLLVFLIQNYYPAFMTQTLAKTAVFIKQKFPDVPVIVHNHIATFYPFSYYFGTAKKQVLVFPSGLNPYTVEIIGGKNIPLTKVASLKKPFLSVNYIWDEKTWKLKEEHLKLSNDYQIKLVKTINDLEIYFYQPR